MKPVSLQSFWLVANVVRAHDGRAGFLPDEIRPVFEAYAAQVQAEIEARKKPPKPRKPRTRRTSKRKALERRQKRLEAINTRKATQ